MLETSDGEATLARTLRRSPDGTVTMKHSMAAAWLQDAVVKKADIDAMLSRYAGMPLANLETFAIARQGQFEILIKATHSDRMALLQTFMGLDQYEDWRKDLFAVRSSIQLPVDRAAELAQLKVELATAEQSLAKFKAQQEQDNQAIARQNDSYSEASRLLQLRTNVAVLKEMETAELEIASFNNSIKACEERMAEIVVEDETPPDADGYAGHKRYKRAQTQWTICKRTAEQKTELLEGLDPKQMINDAADEYEKLRVAVQDLAQKIKELRTGLERHALGTCPTCGQKTELPAGDAAEMQKQLDWMKAEETVTRKSFADAADTHRLAISLEREHHQAQVMLAAAEKEMQESADYAVFDETAYNGAVARMRTAGEGRKAAALIRKETTEYQKRKAVLEDSCRKLRLEETVNEEQYEAASELVEAVDSLVAKRDARVLEIKELDTWLKLKKENETLFTGDQARRERNSAAIRQLEAARDALHPNAIPRLLMQGRVREINDKLHKWLRLFEFPYPGRLTENLDFEVDFGKAKADASELSGGEMIIFAMSARFGMQEVFSCGCGLSILDEPTLNLDRANKTLLLDMLQRAGEYFRERHMTVLVPTHDEDLRAIADHTITTGD